MTTPANPSTQLLRVHQFAALEPPGAEERPIVVDIGPAPEVLVDEVVAAVCVS